MSGKSGWFAPGQPGVIKIGNALYVMLTARGPDEGFVICDDCREAYLDPPYYTFPTEACRESIGNVIPTQHAECTGNLCPECAIDLHPDDEDDPRRQLFKVNGLSEGVKP